MKHFQIPVAGMAIIRFLFCSRTATAFRTPTNGSVNPMLKMNVQLGIALACVFSLGMQAAKADESNDWLQLFNGRDLDGWKASSDPEAFTVVDGAIRVNAIGKAAHLFYVGTSQSDKWVFKDFEMEATVRAEADSNSGIFVHTGPATRNRIGHLRDGYEIQLNSTEKEKRKTGSLYAVQDLPSSPVDETKWFVIKIRVEGKRILVSINDQQVVDYTEPKNPKREKQRVGRLLSDFGGMIALQAHDPDSTWYFRNIRIRTLSNQ